MLKAYEMDWRDVELGKPIEVGDIVTSFRGERAKLLACDRMNEFRYGGRRSGKVYVEWIDGHAGSKYEYYDNVFNITVIDPEFEKMYNKE